MAEQLMRAQLKGSTASINSTAGYKGVLVLNTDTNHLHVLTGEAGNNIELANKTDIPEEVDISGKADLSYVNTQLNTKLGKTEKAESAKVADSATKATKDASGNVITATYATNTALTEGLDTKLNATAKAVSAGTADSATKATQDSLGNVISSTYATKSELTSGLAGKQPVGDYATTTALTEGLAGKANTSHTHATSEVIGLDAALANKADSSDLTSLITKTGARGRLAGYETQTQTSGATVNIGYFTGDYITHGASGQNSVVVTVDGGNVVDLPTAGGVKILFLYDMTTVETLTIQCVNGIAWVDWEGDGAPSLSGKNIVRLVFQLHDRTASVSIKQWT